MKYSYSHSYCAEHPKQELVGVCPLCLNHRLRLLLASSSSSSSKFRFFAFTSSLFYRPAPHLLSTSTSTSTFSTLAASDDSYISMKLGDNGEASWDSKSSGSKQKQKQKVSRKSVVVEEHAKPRPAVSVRWRRRVAQLLQLIRWNKPAGNTTASAQVQAVKKKKRRRSHKAARVRTLNMATIHSHSLTTALHRPNLAS